MKPRVGPLLFYQEKEMFSCLFILYGHNGYKNYVVGWDKGFSLFVECIYLLG